MRQKYTESITTRFLYDLPSRSHFFASSLRCRKTKYCPNVILCILDFVFNHKEITNFVAIDDLNLSDELDGHFVQTDNLINDEQMQKCIEILKGNS